MHFLLVASPGLAGMIALGLTTHAESNFEGRSVSHLEVANTTSSPELRET